MVRYLNCRPNLLSEYSSQEQNHFKHGVNVGSQPEIWVSSYVYLWYLMYICCTLYVFVVPYVQVYLLYYVCIAVLTLDAGLLARSQYPEGPATDHLDTGFSWFPCVYKRMLRWFPKFPSCYYMLLM